MKSEGGYVWACKNYDGDVQSDSVAQVRQILIIDSYDGCASSSMNEIDNYCTKFSSYRVSVHWE